MKKKPFITVETENLAVPEVHIDKEDVEETTDTDDTETITYDNVAVPEIHICLLYTSPSPRDRG